MKSSILDLSIIIVNWRSLDYLVSCIASIRKETRNVNYEIIVVDNASGDDSALVIRERYPDVIFLQSHENLGFAKANNLGYELSRGYALLFLNPDTIVTENVFARMLGQLRSEPSVAAVGPCLLNTDGSVQMSCIQSYPTILNQLLDSELLRRLFPTWPMWGMAPLYSKSSEPANVEAISGACFMVKRAVFERVGLFTAHYFMYVEDIDLSYKITTAGHRIQYLPDCRVVHHGGKSSEKQEAYFANLRQIESHLQFFRTTRGPFYCNCYRAALIVFAALRVALVFCSLPFGRRAFAGKDPRGVLRKWLGNLQWAIELRPLARVADGH